LRFSKQEADPASRLDAVRNIGLQSGRMVARGVID
jgi:hypothetical protein